MLRDSPRRPTRLLALAAAPALLSGCYLAHLAAGQLSMSRASEPIAELAADEATDAGLRARLQYALRVREFATAGLGLPDNGSYRRYADLGRPYATWNLFAAPEFSVQPRRWCFPVAGCVSYRGYFDEARAQRAAGRYGSRGEDVHVAPAIAYSTLGHLRDPVLNTMLAWGDAELAAFLIHELAHQAAYAPGDSDFNEAFATVVEREGLRRWLEREAGGAALATFLAEGARRERMAALLAEARGRLAALYDSGLPPEAMRERKAAEFDRLRAALAAAGTPLAGELNNARLVAIATYHRCVPALNAELERLDHDLPAFYSAMKQLERDAAGRARLCPPR